jgi:hypothetical protein
VRALMRREIDQFHRLRHTSKRGVGYRGRRTRKRKDAAIVVGVRLPIEQNHFRNAENRLDDGVHPGAITPFGKIGDTLYQLSRHELIQ